MRRGAAWLVTIPLALLGVEGAHVLANAGLGSPEGEGEVFASAASGAELAPVLLAVALALVLTGVVSRVAGRRREPGRTRPTAVPFAVLPPLAFVALELAEGILHGGEIPWHDAAEPTFLVGLALQLPFALAGYLVARLLLRAGDIVRELIRRRRPAFQAGHCPSPPGAASPWPAARRPTSHRGRAPPRAVITSS